MKEMIRAETDLEIELAIEMETEKEIENNEIVIEIRDHVQQKILKMKQTKRKKKERLRRDI